MRYFKTLAAAKAEAAKRGIPTGGLKSMAQYSEAIDAHDKNAKQSPIKQLTSVAPKAAVTAVATIGSLKAAIAGEKNLASKINMLQDLRANLLTSMESEKDQAKATELRREFMSAEKKLAYNLLAERQLDPKAAQARRLMVLADRD